MLVFLILQHQSPVFSNFFLCWRRLSPFSRFFLYSSSPTELTLGDIGSLAKMPSWKRPGLKENTSNPLRRTFWSFVQMNWITLCACLWKKSGNQMVIFMLPTVSSIYLWAFKSIYLKTVELTIFSLMSITTHLPLHYMKSFENSSYLRMKWVILLQGLKKSICGKPSN